VELEQRHGLTADPILRLAALTMTGCGREVAGCLKLSRAEGDRIIELDAARDPFDVSSPQAVRRQIYAYGNDGARDRLLLDWLDRIDGAAGAAALTLIESWPRPRFPIKGADIVKMGVPEGPRVGELLEKAESWWIERDFTPDKAACLVFARNQV